MDKGLLGRYFKLMESKNDVDATMGLRGAQSMCKLENVSMADALVYALEHLDQWRVKAAPVVAEPEPEPAPRPQINFAGMPECHTPRPGVIEIVLSGQSQGDKCALPGESARHAGLIASHVKDAVVVAMLNKSRFKLKLNDIRNNRDEIVETVLQAEYDHAGTSPVRIWANNRGEVGALATVLRKFVAKNFPELVLS